MKTNRLVVLALCGASAALAQDSGVSVSVGARAWYAEWTTFSYYVDAQGVNRALIQVSADDKLVLLPVLSVRYGNFVGSLGALASTQLTFTDGSRGTSTREEFDANLGYIVIPGVSLSLGYKKIAQVSGQFAYRPAGPVAGLNANAPLDGALSLYGALGLGRMRTGAGDSIQFKADYRLTESGLAYTLNTNGLVRRWTFTGGYRIQVMSSKEAFGSQDGRDTTQGFTFGAFATF